MKNRLLLVDDEEDIRTILSLSLADRGYDVLTAENGSEGLELFRKHRPSIVITDIKMPGMDGITLLEKIKDEDPDTEIIMITGHGDMELAIRSFRKDAVEFIVKPIDIHALDGALRKVKEKITIREQLRRYTRNLEAMVHAGKAGVKDLEGETAKVGREFGELFDDLPFHVTLQDRSLRLAAVNRRFRNDFGGEIGDLCHKVCKKSDEPCKDCPVIRTFEHGSSNQGEIELKDKKGEETHLFYWTTPVKDTRNRITHVMVMLTNMTQVLNAHDHLASLGLMVGTVSHGIKGLLTGLDGGIYLMDTGLDKDDRERVQKGLQIVKRLIGHIRRMVLDILFYAKEKELKFEKTDIAGFVGDLAGVVKKKIADNDITLTSRIPEDCGEFEIDSDYLHTAMVNILENAVDACIEDKEKTDHKIELSVVHDHDKDEIVLGIKDNGIGMDEVTKDKIFSLFYSAKGKKGTGLGLFVTRHIIRQHGGGIEVESVSGEGTLFSVRIPVLNHAGI